MKKSENIGGNVVLEGGRALVVGEEWSNDLTSHLQRVGLSVVVASNSLEALVNAFQSVQQGHTYDMVLINTKLLLLDGDRTAMSIRKLKEYRNVPILAFAAGAEAQALGDRVPAGINELVTLPLDAVDTLNRLQYWLCHGKEDAAKGMGALDFDGVEMLEGIDLQTGLSHLAGNWKLYRDLLLKFSHSHARFAAQLVEMLESGILVDAGRMIHTLKGLSGSLGMYRLHLLSQQLEEIVRHGVMGEPAALVQPLTNELDRVLASILANISSGDTARPAQPVSVAIARLLELERTLSDHNPEAAQQVNEIGNIMGYESEMARLKKAVAAYEFDTALAVLQEIKSSPNAGSVHKMD